MEHRFERAPDGSIWSRAGYRPEYWRGPLELFDTVQVLARVRDVREPAAGSRRCDGDGVAFAALPHYVGPAQYLRRRAAVQRAARAAARQPAAFLLRLPSQLATLLRVALESEGKPFGALVLGDPETVFAPGSMRHPLRPLLRRLFARRQRAECAAACAVAFVTSHALQAKYPPSRDAFVTSFSDVQLMPEDFVAQARGPRPASATVELVTVASMTQLYKAPDVLLASLAACRAAGLDARLTLVGDGACRPRLERRARELGLSPAVRFLGELPAGEAVRAELDRADLFVLASRAEGLPRAMIEAMARGLPCVGSAVGGIPELLPSSALVPPGDVPALAARLLEVLRAPALLAEMSARNLERARHYQAAQLAGRQRTFYHHLQQATLRWQQTTRERAR
jgi:glycosyltransferase involved in cell wall biosynthesis